MASRHRRPSPGLYTQGLGLHASHPHSYIEDQYFQHNSKPTAEAAVPSFAAFRRNNPPPEHLVPPSARQRPVSIDASSPVVPPPSNPLASPSRQNAVTFASRPSSVDSPQLRYPENQTEWFIDITAASPEAEFLPRDLDQYPHGTTPLQLSPRPHQTSIDDRLLQTSSVYYDPEQRPNSNLSSLSRPRLDRSVTSYHTAQDSVSDVVDDSPDADDGDNERSDSDYSAGNMSSRASPKPPDLTLELDGSLRTLPNDPAILEQLNAHNAKSPRSPGPNLSSFFGWKKSAQNPVASPSTTFSDSRSVSPGPSPVLANEHSQLPHTNMNSSTRHNDDDRFDAASLYSDSSSGSMPAMTPELVTHVDELAKELREISAELAASIRREMELEDEVERYRQEMPTAPQPDFNRRTSDYFSDSGASSTRWPASDSDTKMEGLERMRRKAEQERAQLRLDMAEKMQQEHNQRRALELHVQSLEEQLQSTADGIADERSERVSQLESALDDTRRRLNEERTMKQNYEDLLNGMREENQSHRNEADNLRDEVVPQLRSRLEGLEAQVAEMQNMAYENAKMDQELQSLRNENQTLVNARRLQLDLQSHNPRFRTIAEEDEPQSPGSPRQSMNLSRTNSLARSKSLKHRSGSVTKDPAEADKPQDTIKEIEDQRDALHRTLKALILRQDSLTREHGKRIKTLQSERDRALTGTPRRAAFAIEVKHLRSEIDALRSRADEAMEQKWQCEKGLSGLKMDLDRAQQETTSLRELLHERDMSTTQRRPSSSGSGSDSGDGMAEQEDSLNAAYVELRTMLTATLRSAQSPTAAAAATERMQSLIPAIEAQLASNRSLRQRLAVAVDRGVSDQQASATKIVDLQNALRAAEERVMHAQQESEDAVKEHEEHIKGADDARLELEKRGVRRLSQAVAASPSLLAPASSKRGSMATIAGPRSPGAAMFGARSPRLDKTSSGDAASVREDGRTEALERRVRELELAAGRADSEMQVVVETMNRAQIEVAGLQTERDEAMKQTRQLQREILEEREKFRGLAGGAMAAAPVPAEQHDDDDDEGSIFDDY